MAAAGAREAGFEGGSSEVLCTDEGAREPVGEEEQAVPSPMLIVAVVGPLMEADCTR